MRFVPSRSLLALVALTLAATPMVTHAAVTVREPRPPMAENLVGPLQFAVESRNSVVVGESFAGLLSTTKNGMHEVILAVPDGEVAGVALANGGTYFASSTFDPSTGMPANGSVSFTKRGKLSVVADLSVAEAATNPDAGVEYGFVGISEECAAQLPPDFGPATYTGIVDSHPYGVAVQRKTVYVADAGANVIWEVAPNGDVGVLALLPSQPLPVDAGLAGAFGLPDCVIGLDYHFEAVPTDVEVGANNWLYVTTLPGGPEDPGFPGRGAAWRIHLRTGEIQLLASGLAGATNIAVGPKGTVWVTELFGGQVSQIVRGEAVPKAFLPAPAAIEYAHGQLYVAYDVFGPNGKIATISR